MRDITVKLEREFTPSKRRMVIRQANQFRALAWHALRDGAPKGSLRAANCRTAARRILQSARSVFPAR